MINLPNTLPWVTQPSQAAVQAGVLSSRPQAASESRDISHAQAPRRAQSVPRCKQGPRVKESQAPPCPWSGSGWWMRLAVKGGQCEWHFWANHGSFPFGDVLARWVRHSHFLVRQTPALVPVSSLLPPTDLVMSHPNSFAPWPRAPPKLINLSLVPGLHCQTSYLHCKTFSKGRQN